MEEIRADEWAGDAGDISGRRRLAWSTFADLGPVLDWIWEQLVTRSPVGGLGGASCGLRRCTASSASWR
jgi:hypothetical protein